MGSGESIDAVRELRVGMVQRSVALGLYLEESQNNFTAIQMLMKIFY